MKTRPGFTIVLSGLIVIVWTAALLLLLAEPNTPQNEVIPTLAALPDHDITIDNLTPTSTTAADLHIAIQDMIQTSPDTLPEAHVVEVQDAYGDEVTSVTNTSHLSASESEYQDPAVINTWVVHTSDDDTSDPVNEKTDESVMLMMNTRDDPEVTPEPTPELPKFSCNKVYFRNQEPTNSALDFSISNTNEKDTYIKRIVFDWDNPALIAHYPDIAVSNILHDQDVIWTGNSQNMLLDTDEVGGLNVSRVIDGSDTLSIQFINHPGVILDYLKPWNIADTVLYIDNPDSDTDCAIRPNNIPSLTTLRVTTTEDGNDGACTESHCTLREAIIKANGSSSYDWIDVPAGTYTLTLPDTSGDEDYAATGDLDIRNAIIIRGESPERTIIDGNALGRVFDIHQVLIYRVTIENLTIQNGYSDDGAGVALERADVSLINVNVKNNEGKYNGVGSGIYASLANPRVVHSIVEGNHEHTAPYGGVGVGIYITDADTYIIDSIFRDNQSTTGSVIGAYGSYLVFDGLHIISSSIHDNIGTGISSAAYEIYIDNTTISGNTGRGITINDYSYGPLLVNHSTIVDNDLPAIYIGRNASTTITNSILYGNGADAGDCSRHEQGHVHVGADTIMGDPADCDLPEVTIVDPYLKPLAFKGNFTPTHDLEEDSPAIDMVSCTLAQDQRGVSRPQGENCDVGAVEYKEIICPVVSFNIVDGDVTGLVEAINAANDEICHPGEDTITLATEGTYAFTTYDNTDDYGANAMPVISSDIIIEGNGATITRESADYFRFFFIEAAASLTLNNLTLDKGHLYESYSSSSETSDKTSGGAIRNQGTLAFTNSTLKNNTALGNAAYKKIGQGGAIWNAGTASFINTIFEANESDYGGVLYNAGELNLQQSMARSNTASQNGGVIYHTESTLTITDSEFDANGLGSSTAGVIWVDNHDTIIVTITRSLFHNHTTGYVLYTRASTTSQLTLTNSTFSNNTGTYVMSLDGAGDLRHNTIVNNSYGILIKFNSITFTANILDNTVFNCSFSTGSIASGGYNISGDSKCNFAGVGDLNNADLRIMQLGNYGGLTQTHYLYMDSPAIDAIPVADCTVDIDQRGISRPYGEHCDSGAVEIDAELCPVINFTIPANKPGRLIEAINAANDESCYPGPDTITLTENTYNITAYDHDDKYGLTAFPTINSDITIKGNGATFYRQSTDSFRYFVVESIGHLTLEDVTVRVGRVYESVTDPNSTGMKSLGGAIFNRGILTIRNSEFIGNSVNYSSSQYLIGKGGAIWNEGVASFMETTFDGNQSDYGAAIANIGEIDVQRSYFTDQMNGSTIETSHIANIQNSRFYRNRGGSGVVLTNGQNAITTITGSLFDRNISGNAVKIVREPGENPQLYLLNNTLSNNSGYYVVYGGGRTYLYHNTIANNLGGIGFYDNVTELSGNIISGNSLGNCGFLGGSFTSTGYNISNDDTCNFTATGDLNNTDPLLAVLADNGGPTQTRAIQSNSPAFEAIPVDNCIVSTDQRDVSRPQGLNCDIGAYEYQIPQPAAPTNLQAGNITLISLDLSWTDNADDETGFVIERSLDGESWTELVTLGVNSTTYSDSTLTCGTAYSYRVKAINLGGDSAYTNVVTPTTDDCPPPSAPTDLQVDNITVTSLNLSWTDNADNETSFVIEQSLNGTDWSEIGTTGENIATYAVTGLDCNTAYQYRVKAVNAWGDSAYSNSVSPTIGACPTPNTPTNLQATPDASGSVLLAWTDKSNNETGFAIEQSEDGINWAEIDTVDADVTAYEDTTVACFMDYSYRVRAENNGTYSGYTNIAAVTSGCPAPIAPSDLQVTGVGQDSISLSWTDNATHETAYYVQHSMDGIVWMLIATNLPADSTTFTHTGLICNSTHSYRVRAYRQTDDKLSVPSNVVTDTTHACPTLSKPTSPAQGTTSRTTAEVQWNNDFSGEASAVFVERSLDGANWASIAELPPTADSFSDTILICGTSYQYRIRAYREEDNSYSPYSDVLILSTDACPVAVTNTMGLYKDGVWMFRDSNDSGVLDVHFLFGPQQPGWTPLIGDWDGDGVDGIGLYKDGKWIFRNSSDNGPLDIVMNFAMPGDGWLPIVGDWNGDDIDTPALYKAGTVAIKNSNTSGPAEARYIYGPQETGWLPIAGDWNGSGTDTVSFYKAGQWIIYNGFTNSSYAIRFNYGPAEAGWIPLAGDWDQNLSDTIGLYKGGNWRLRNSNSAGVVDLGFTFGTQATGWQPVASYRGAASGLNVMGMAPINPLAEPVTNPTIEPTLETSTPVPTVIDQPEITPEPTLPPETPEPTATDLPEVTPEPMLPPATDAPTITPTPEPVEPTATTEPSITPTEAASTPLPEVTDEPSGD